MGENNSCKKCGGLRVSSIIYLEFNDQENSKRCVNCGLEESEVMIANRANFAVIKAEVEQELKNKPRSWTFKNKNKNISDDDIEDDGYKINLYHKLDFFKNTFDDEPLDRDGGLEDKEVF